MNFRMATLDDAKDIVALLADDELGKTRERPYDTVDEVYIQSFKDIEEQKDNQILL